jgi:hypothetical protein
MQTLVSRWFLMREVCGRLEQLDLFRHPAEVMPKRKKSKLKVPKEARRRARLGIGLPPAERTIPDKREKRVKHKKTLTDLLGGE